MVTLNANYGRLYIGGYECVDDRAQKLEYEISATSDPNPKIQETHKRRKSDIRRPHSSQDTSPSARSVISPLRWPR